MGKNGYKIIADRVSGYMLGDKAKMYVLFGRGLRKMLGENSALEERAMSIWLNLPAERNRKIINL